MTTAQAEAREWYERNGGLRLCGWEDWQPRFQQALVMMYTAARNAGANNMRHQVFELIKNLRSGPRDPAVSEAVASVLFTLAKGLAEGGTVSTPEQAEAQKHYDATRRIGQKFWHELFDAERERLTAFHAAARNAGLEAAAEAVLDELAGQMGEYVEGRQIVETIRALKVGT